MAINNFQYLVQTNPTLTGAEILKLHEEEVRKEGERIQKLHQDKIDFVKDITKNGGYFKSSMGTSRFMHRVFNVSIDNEGYMSGSVETIHIHQSDNNQIIHDTKKYQSLHKYAFSSYERITKEEFDTKREQLRSIFNEGW